MIYFDGKQWKKHKYKVSVTVTQYGDFLDGFPENSTREEVVLTPVSML